MGFKKKLKRSYFYMFIFPTLIIILITSLTFLLISERYEQQLENISDEAILTAAVQSVIKDFKEVKDYKYLKIVERSYNNMLSFLDRSGYHMSISVNGIETYNTFNESDINILEKYDDSLYEAGDFMTLDNGEDSIIKQRFMKGDDEYLLYAVNENYNDEAVVLIDSIKSIITWIVVLITLLTIIIIYIFNRVLSQRTTKMILPPLEKLSMSARQIRDGNLDCSVSYDSDDEFSTVCSDFDDMRLRLKKSVEEEIAMEENRKALFAGISHDLRSPLTSVKGYSKALIDGIATTEEKRNEYYSVIYQKACEVDNLVDKLFLFSKLDTKKYPFHFTNIKIIDYLKTFEENYYEHYNKNNLLFNIKNNCYQGTTLYIDIEEMDRVITNILDNSNKYKAEEWSVCNINCYTKGIYVYIEVSDNGPGVPEDTLAQLFDAFFRTEESRTNTKQGSGLGLAIAKNIIEAHNGEISAYNKDGLVIRIKLPIVLED